MKLLAAVFIVVMLLFGIALFALTVLAVQSAPGKEEKWQHQRKSKRL